MFCSADYQAEDRAFDDVDQLGYRQQRPHVPGIQKKIHMSLDSAKVNLAFLGNGPAYQVNSLAPSWDTRRKRRQCQTTRTTSTSW